MASSARIQTLSSDLLDAALYESPQPAGLPVLTRGTVAVALSRAFDLVEGARAGHAHRVAYIGLSLAHEVGLSERERGHVVLAGLLHDIGMAEDGGAGSHERGATGDHASNGAACVRALGFDDAVAAAVERHHAREGGAGSDDSPVSQMTRLADRVEGILGNGPSPLVMRRRGPAAIAALGGDEFGPELVAGMLTVTARDEFWLGLYDVDLTAPLTAAVQGSVLERDDLLQFLGAVGDMVDRRSHKEVGCSRRVAELARKLALTCDMSERRADLVQAAALVQDVGTLGIPRSILGKPDILTIDELAVVQSHPLYARDILSELPGFAAAAWWVGCHHERVDGKGYPSGLEGDEVPVEAQIIGICEAYDALTSERAYRRSLSPADAMEVIRGLSGTRFSPYLLSRFEGVVNSYVA